MARLELTGLASHISGYTGGIVLYDDRLHKTTVARKKRITKHSYAGTPLQKKTCINWRIADSFYSTTAKLSPVDFRLLWRNAVKRRKMSGYDLFMSESIPWLHVNYPDASEAEKREALKTLTPSISGGFQAKCTQRPPPAPDPGMYFRAFCVPLWDLILVEYSWQWFPETQAHTADYYLWYRKEGDEDWIALGKHAGTYYFKPVCDITYEFKATPRHWSDRGTRWFYASAMCPCWCNTTKNHEYTEDLYEGQIHLLYDFQWDPGRYKCDEPVCEVHETYHMLWYAADWHFLASHQHRYPESDQEQWYLGAYIDAWNHCKDGYLTMCGNEWDFYYWNTSRPPTVSCKEDGVTLKICHEGPPVDYLYWHSHFEGGPWNYMGKYGVCAEYGPVACGVRHWFRTQRVEDPQGGIPYGYDDGLCPCVCNTTENHDQREDYFEGQIHLLYDFDWKEGIYECEEPVCELHETAHWIWIMGGWWWLASHQHRYSEHHQETWWLGSYVAAKSIVKDSVLTMCGDEWTFYWYPP